MKNLFKLLVAGFVAAAAAFGQVTPPPPAATQAEVNAGTVPNKYVSPLTLHNWSGGGGGGSPGGSNTQVQFNDSGSFGGDAGLTYNKTTDTLTTTALVANSLTSVSGSALTLATGTSGTALTIASATNRIGIGATDPSYLLHVVSSSSSTGRIALESTNTASVQGPYYLGIRSRGTHASPADVTNGDLTLSLQGQAYSGGGYFAGAEISFPVDGTFTSGLRPPSRIEFYTNAAHTAQTLAATIASTGITTFGFNTGISTASAADRSLFLDTPGGQNRNVVYRTGGVDRWNLRVKSTAESGANAGSDFALNARADDGSNLGDYLLVSRATGAATFSGNLYAGYYYALNGGIDITRDGDASYLLQRGFSSNTTGGGRRSTYKARGTLASPTTIVSGDYLTEDYFYGYDGATNIEGAAIQVLSTGTIGTNRVPTKMIFKTHPDSTSGDSVALTLGADQSATVAGLLIAGSGATTLTDSAGKILSAALNTVAVANGGTGLTSASTSGNVLTSNGSVWVSSAPAAAAAGSLTGTTLAANVVTSSLTTVGALGATQISSIELGNASDTTLSRSSAGVMAVEGVAVDTVSATNTLTNKRITLRIATLTDAATVTPATDAFDGGILTTLGQATQIANPTGTPTEGQKYTLRIKSTTSRALTYGSQFRGSADLALPSATSGGSLTDYFVFQWNVADSKWDLLGRNFGF